MAGPWPRGRRRAILSQGISGSFAAPPGAAQSPQGASPMTWSTPQACDFRFGFEITMYVAAR